MTSSIKTSFVDGVFVEAQGDSNLLENRNPSRPAEIVDRFARADAALTAKAIDAAKAASREWRRSNPQVRAAILDRIGSEILARREELAELLSREEGKIVREALGEVDRAGHSFKFYAQEALRANGEKYDSVREGVGIDVFTQPVGVIGVISPWNFPIAIPAWKIAPALAFGNTVVFKPAELVPSSAWALAEIIARSGLPAGVFNMLIGPGRVVGDAILRSPQIDAITFTGSESTGRQVARIAAERLIRVQLEMGGKNPLVVLDDADLDIAVEVALNGSFYSTGQRCTASSRVIVTEGIHDASWSGLPNARAHFAWAMRSVRKPILGQSSIPLSSSRILPMSNPGWRRERSGSAAASIWKTTRVRTAFRPHCSPAYSRICAFTAKRSSDLCSPCSR